MLILFTRDFPGGPVVKTVTVKTSLQGPQVQSLVGELPTSHGVAKKKVCIYIYIYLQHQDNFFLTKNYMFSRLVCVCVCLISRVSMTLCNPMDYSLPGSSVHGIFQARILEQVAISYSSGASWPRDWTWVSCVPALIVPCANWETMSSRLFFF